MAACTLTFVSANPYNYRHMIGSREDRAKKRRKEVGTVEWLDGFNDTETGKATYLP